jgi:hypothetical protein
MCQIYKAVNGTPVLMSIRLYTLSDAARIIARMERIFGGLYFYA